jgi:hypothetical protein
MNTGSQLKEKWRHGQWLLQQSALRTADSMGSHPYQWKAVVSLSKKLFIALHWLVPETI